MNKNIFDLFTLLFILSFSVSIEKLNGSPNKSNSHKSLLQLLNKKDIISQTEFDKKINNYLNNDNVNDYINKYKKILLSTKTLTEDGNDIIIHSPTKKETNKMRHKGIVTLIIFFASYLIFRLGYNKVKNINYFLGKGIKILANQIFLLFFCFSLLVILYVYGLFDDILINWEYVINMIGSVILYWIVFNLVLLVFSIFVNHKWKSLEKGAFSFEALKKDYKGVNKNKAKECFEFLILKRYLFLPLFPTLKSCSLNKDLEFSFYLESCLLKRFKLFFKISWTCWFSFIISLMIYNVFISKTSILTKTVILMIIPILGVIIVSFIYFYCKKVYRKVVREVTEQNMTNFKDIDYTSNDIFQQLVYPTYIDNIVYDNDLLKKASEKNITLHE